MRQEAGRLRGRVYTETRGAGQPWLSAPILSFIPSHSVFSPTRCVNPTHLFLHFWVQSRPPLLASSHVPHTNPSSSTWKGCSFPLSFLQGCSPVSTCTAWLSRPFPMDLRAVAAPANTHCCSCPLLHSSLDPLQSPAR